MNKLLFLSVLIFSQLALAKVCKSYGPQTPRDISQKKGSNKVTFNLAPPVKDLNLCNIHFHKNAEHKGPGFNLSGGKGDHGGWKCNETPSLGSEALKAPKKNTCDNIVPGDTIEVHFVHTTCNTKPGKGLGSCVDQTCANPQVRVKSKVFLLVNDKKALNFNKFAKVRKRRGFYQMNSIPDMTDAVEFIGSSTGPKYTEEKCSAYQASWNVSPNCALLDINSVHKWCKKNIFEENHAHGVRQIVKNPKLLSEIQ